MATFFFASESDFAEAFCKEAGRHLGDARILFMARRYAASIASCAKSVELAVKSALILNGAFNQNRYEILLKTHKPITELKGGNAPLYFKELPNLITLQSPDLVRRIQNLEALEPSSFNIKNANPDPNQEPNPEYPFEAVERGGAYPVVVLKRPEVFFTQVEASEHYDTARETLLTLRLLCPKMNAWPRRLPNPL